MSTRHSFTQAVYDYLTARPGQWVRAVDLDSRIKAVEEAVTQ